MPEVYIKYHSKLSKKIKYMIKLNKELGYNKSFKVIKLARNYFILMSRNKCF